MPHIKGRQQREGPTGTQSANPQTPCLTYGPLCIEVGTLLSASSLDLCLEAGGGLGCSPSPEPVPTVQ